MSSMQLDALSSDGEEKSRPMIEICDWSAIEITFEVTSVERVWNERRRGFSMEPY